MNFTVRGNLYVSCKHQPQFPTKRKLPVRARWTGPARNNEFDSRKIRNYLHVQTMICKRCLGMQGEVRKWQRERKKKMVLYKFTRRDEGDDGARNAACAPGANLALGSSLKFPFSIRRENGPRKKKKKRKYRCRPAKREGNECKPVLTSWPSLSLCARRHSYSSRSRYKSYSTGERNFRARS